MRFYHPTELDHRSSNQISRRKKERDAKININAAIKSALSELSTIRERREAFLRLLACIREHTALLRPSPGQGSAGWVAPAFLINRLKHIAMRHRFWVRPCETWAPNYGNPRLVFRSLAHHLFAQYPMPAYMDSVWDLPAGPDAFRQQAWYIRL